jgi:hypothetical protein
MPRRRIPNSDFAMGSAAVLALGESGPLVAVRVVKAVAFKEALAPEFREYRHWAERRTSEKVKALCGEYPVYYQREMGLRKTT